MGRTGDFFVNWFAFGLDKACEMDQRQELIDLQKEQNEILKKRDKINAKFQEL